jgi:MFS family permease
VSPTFKSLRIRNYRYFAIGAVVSNVGTWMQRVAQDWLVLDLTHGDGVALGITTALQFLPMLLFGLWGGVLADRYPKRLILLATQSFMGAVAIVLGLLTVTGQVEVWQVYVLAFLLGTGAAIDNPTRNSFVVEMVGNDDLPNAVGLNSASFNAGRVVGPALAGVLLMVVGTGWVFLLNGLSFIAVLTALVAIRSDELMPSPLAPRGRGALREGLRYVLGRRDLLLVIVVVAFVATFGLNFQMTNALMAKEVFDKSAGAYGLLGTSMAVGSLSGALMAARRGKPKLRMLLGAAIAFGVLELTAGLLPNYWMYVAILPFIGFASLTFLTAANATMQLGADPVMRGRVMGLYMLVFFGGTPLGAPVIGWLAETFGARWSLLGGGMISAVTAIIAALLLARREGLVVRAHVRPRPHLHVRNQTEPTAVH